MSNLFFSFNRCRHSFASFNRIFYAVSRLSCFYKKFSSLSNLLWQEGLYVDFTQKKIVDAHTRKFLVNAAYLFSERAVFELITKFFLVNVLTPFHRLFIFEFNSIANLIFSLLFILIIFYFVYFFVFILISIF